MKKAVLSLSVSLAALLSACGGGGGNPKPTADNDARATPLATTSAAAVSRLDHELLFDWAEKNYPHLFPGHPPTLQSPPYDYRYYRTTGNYVGVAGDDVYILGPVSNQVLQRVGAREDFRCRVTPSSCGPSADSRAGWSASLSRLQHGVSGTVSIVDARTLRLNNFNYDGGGPLVYVYLSSEDSNPAFSAGLAVGAPLERRAYVNETLELTLPQGQTLDKYTAVSIWCARFGVNFGSGVFVAPTR